MPFDINEFKAQINKSGGLAKPTNFRVLFTGNILHNSKARALAMLANRASIPGRAIATNEIRTYGPIRKAPYNSIYDDLQVSVYCTNDNLFPRDLFMEWQDAIIEGTTGRVNYFDHYVSDIEVEQYDDMGKTIFACKFIDAYPVIVAPLALDWSARDQVQNLDVTFAYRKWQIQPLPLLPFGNNLTINSLYPNFDVGSTLDKFGLGILNRADGQFLGGFKQMGNFLGNVL